MTKKIADHDQWVYFKDGGSKIIRAGQVIPPDCADSPAAFEVKKKPAKKVVNSDDDNQPNS